MSVIVKNMEMPKNCFECPCCTLGYCRVDVKTTEYAKYVFSDGQDGRHPDCPLIELPPHGRLIDKDKLRRELFVNFNGERIPFYDCDNFPIKIAYRDLHSILAEQKTVVEAEGETE